MIEVRPEQKEKASIPILVTELGIAIEVRPEQSMKALFPILVKLQSIVTDSKFVQSENESLPIVCKLFGNSIDEKKVFNTYIGVSDSFRPVKGRNLFEKVKRKYGFTAEKYLFSLCNIEERKNLIMQAKAFIRFISENKINDLVFLMGGGAQHFHILEKELEEEIPAELIKNIVFIGYVDDEDLPVLYSNAMWFTYTSKYEGFGLPPLEAMKCGCPVVTSNRSSLPEVCGDAAIIVDSDNENEHVKAYKAMYSDDDLRNAYSEKGIKQVQKFNWSDIASHMYELMCSIRK